MTAFHAFVTGMANRYSGIKAEDRNLKGQKELQALVNSGKSTPTNSKTFGSMTFTPTDVSDFTDDRKIYQGIADYANMFDANDKSAFDSLTDSEKNILRTDILGAWDTFTDLVSPGTGGSGDNIKEYYRKFSNLDAFKHMPDLHAEMLRTDPTNSVLGKVVYDSNHEILGIGNQEQGTPAIFQPEDMEGMMDKGVQQGEMTSIPSSLIMKPKKWGGTYDFGGVVDGVDQEKLFYDNVNSILTSRQFGGMELAQADALMNDEKNPWKSFAVYAAYGNSTTQMSDETFGREMAELQSIYGVSDKELFDVVAKGVQKYDIQSGTSGGTRVNITRRFSDLTESQKKAMDNAIVQATAIIEDTGLLLDAWQAGEFKAGAAGTIEKFARGIYFDEGSILKELNFLDDDKAYHVNFEGLGGKRKATTLFASTFTSDPTEKESLAWHVAGLRKSISKRNDKAGHYWDYEKNHYVKKEQYDKEGLNYQARKVLEMSLAYRLTVMEQGSGGNTISDKDFKAALERIRGGWAVSKEQIVGGLTTILGIAARTQTLAALQAEHSRAGIKLPLLYNEFRKQKRNVWNEIEEKFEPYMYNKIENPTIDNPNDVMANRVNKLKGTLNWKLGIFNKDEALFRDLSDKEMAYAFGDDGFFFHSDSNLGTTDTKTKNVVTKETITNSSTPDDQSVPNENLWTDKSGTFAQEGYIKLPSKMDKRPDRVARYTAPFRSDEEMQKMLEKDQKHWDVNYGQWYNPDGTVKGDMSEISFADISKLFKRKSKIIDLIQSRKIPRPDNLPGEVPPRPILPEVGKGRMVEQSPEYKTAVYMQKAWDLKYSKYYTPEGLLIVNPNQANKSFIERTKENF